MTPTTAEGVVARGGGRDGSSTEPEGICVGGTIILSFKIERRGVVYWPLAQTLYGTIHTYLVYGTYYYYRRNCCPPHFLLCTYLTYLSSTTVKP